MSAFDVTIRYVSRVPLGTKRVDALVGVEPAGLPDGDTAAALRIWTPAGARVVAVRELIPRTRGLLEWAAPVDERTVEYGVGHWLDGVPCEYQLGIEVPACADGDRLLAARVTVLADGSVAGGGTVAVNFGGLATAPAAGAAPVDLTKLPTAPSPRPHHTGVSAHAGEPCPGCGEQTLVDDRFCEGCGHALVGDPV